MAENLPYREQLVNTLVKDHIDKLFYFCLKKTGNSFEAEDLTSDILLNILSSLEKGLLPISFSTWVWQIARNRYCVWAEKKHRHNEWLSGSDIGDYEIEDEDAKLEDQLMQSENMALLRRELAFISSEYRNIIVAYYIEDRKIKDIAASLHLPEGTVKSRLFRARKILKEGMNMAREFGVRSYKPEDIDFATSGYQPSGLPDDAIKRKLPKNILLEADNNPMTVEKLAIELGTAVPYMEEEVELLVRATLLKKVGDKYVTSFFIVNKECRLKIYYAQRKTSKERSAIVDTIVSDSLEEIRAMGIVPNGMSDADLKWWATIYAVDHFIQTLDVVRYDWPEMRSNGEVWGIMGLEKIELPEKCRMCHSGSGQLGRDICWVYKISDYKLWNRVGEMEIEETLFLADVLKNKRKLSSFTDAESRLWKKIENRFAHTEEDGSITADILVIPREKLRKIEALWKAHPLSEKLIRNLSDTFEETVQILKKSSNPLLKDQLAYCASMQILNIRMMTVHDAVEAGNLTVPADPKNSTIATWLEFN